MTKEARNPNSVARRKPRRKSEVRIPKSEGNPNLEFRSPKKVRMPTWKQNPIGRLLVPQTSGFGFPSDFGIRISGFFRHSVSLPLPNGFALARLRFRHERRRYARQPRLVT